MALTDIERIRWSIGDNPSSPFYPLLPDEVIQDFIDQNGGNLNKASIQCAYAAGITLMQKNTKEKVGEIEVWNEARKQLYDFLKDYIKNQGSSVNISGIIPYAAGISVSDLEASAADPDNPRRYSYLYTLGKDCSTS